MSDPRVELPNTKLTDSLSEAVRLFNIWNALFTKYNDKEQKYRPAEIALVKEKIIEDILGNTILILSAQKFFFRRSQFRR